MTRQTKPPAYRRHTVAGCEYAVVTLTDSRTRKRKDYHLGPYGSAESRQRYSRLLTEWEAAGRCLPGVVPAAQAIAGGPTVAQVCLAYWESIQGRYDPGREAGISSAIRVFGQLYGSEPASSIGPNALRLVRQAMVDGDPDAEPRPRKPWSRRNANDRTRTIVSIYKWAVAHELLPATVYEALRTLEPLKRGQTTAREPEPVRPVPDEFVDAALEFLRPQVRAMVELQRATGMRPGEVVTMRTRDLDTTGPIWTYNPQNHKTAHHGHARHVYIGPRGQDILRPWLRTNLDEHLFQPCEAVADQLADRHAARTTPLKYGNRPGTNRKANPKCQPRDHYTVDTYRRAITRACDLADKAAEDEADAESNGDRLIPRWHPHQLRHNYATAVRKRFGVEAARVVLGHQHIDVTELYAERDQAVGVRVAKTIG